MDIKKIALTLILSLFLFCAKGQLIMQIEKINIDYDVTDRSRLSGLITDRVYENPRIKLNIVINNSSPDSVKLNTNYAFLMEGDIQYNFKCKKISLKNAGWMNSDEVIDTPYVCIAPNQSYQFYLSFEPEPKKYFRIENYRKHIWHIIPTLKIVIRQSTPQPLLLESEPIDWKSITVSNNE